MTLTDIRPPRTTTSTAATPQATGWVAAATVQDSWWTTPHHARIADLLLGGLYHSPADRRLVEDLSNGYPPTPRVPTTVAALAPVAWHQRAFQHRAARALLAAGVRQFVDLSGGIATLGALHDTTRHCPDARVVYVAGDPVIHALNQHLLAGQPNVVVIGADLRNPHTVLTDPHVTEVLDVAEPVGVFALSILHHLTTDPTAMITRAWREATVAGSYLVLSHLCHDQPFTRHAADITDLAAHATIAGIPTVSRTRARIQGLFHGWQLLEPGLVWTGQWRPDPDAPPDLGHVPWRAGLLAGVAVNPLTAVAGNDAGLARPTSSRLGASRGRTPGRAGPGGHDRHGGPR
jgi:hypothetical protein